MALDLAECVCGARVCYSTGIEALPVDTGVPWRTLGVIRALRSQHRNNVGGDFQALDLGIASVANGTGAARSMQAGLANSIGPAGIYVTCVPAGAFNTLVWVPTVPVYRTGGHRGHFRLALSVWPNK